VQAVGDQVGIAGADLSTGELRLIVASRGDADAALARLAPRELLVPSGADALAAMATALGALATPREGWEFDPALAEDALARHFEVQSVEGFGIGAADAVATGAAGALLRYLRELQPAGVPHLARPVIERPGGVMPLDEMTRRNLELVESLRAPDDTTGTLLGVLDRTQTPMGARLLRQWILAPLTDVAAITARLDAVESLFTDARWRARRCARRSTACATWSAWRARRRPAGRRRATCGPSGIRWRGCPSVRGARARAYDTRRTAGRDRRGVGRRSGARGGDPAHARGGAPTAFGDGTRRSPPGWMRRSTSCAPWRRRQGCDRGAAGGGARAHRDQPSLKVGYNRVFGYYIEITNAHRTRCPPTTSGARRSPAPSAT
jgi:DNA mismatch repair protein MutS